jgi:hypothetical protein
VLHQIPGRHDGKSPVYVYAIKRCVSGKISRKSTIWSEIGLMPL